MAEMINLFNMIYLRNECSLNTYFVQVAEFIAKSLFLGSLESRTGLGKLFAVKGQIVNIFDFSDQCLSQLLNSAFVMGKQPQAICK